MEMLLSFMSVWHKSEKIGVPTVMGERMHYEESVICGISNHKKGLFIYVRNNISIKSSHIMCDRFADWIYCMRFTYLATAKQSRVSGSAFYINDMKWWCICGRIQDQDRRFSLFIACQLVTARFLWLRLEIYFFRIKIECSVKPLSSDWLVSLSTDWLVGMIKNGGALQ